MITHPCRMCTRPKVVLPGDMTWCLHCDNSECCTDIVVCDDGSVCNINTGHRVVTWGTINDVVKSIPAGPEPEAS